jgi:protein-S-isoprenylcysteine O-methyltransferase Ste14
MFHPIALSRLQLALALVSIFFFAAAVVEKRLQTRGSLEPATARSRLSLAGIVMQAFAFGVAGGGPINPTANMFTPLSLALSLFVGCAGLTAVLLFRSSARALGQNWSLVARTRAKHSLVTEGPFATVRHPIYLAMLLLLVAVGLGFGHVLALIPSVLLFFAGTAIRIREEERLLIGQFGDRYRAYARETPAFIPRLP